MGYCHSELSLFLSKDRISLHALDHQAGQAEEADGVGNDHQVIEHIRQLPHQVVGGQGTQEDEYQGNQRINHDGFPSEEVSHVDLAEEVPPQNGGEGEEEQADGHKHGPQILPKHHAEGRLGQVGLADDLGDGAGIPARQGAALGVEGGDDHQGVEGQHHEGINEHADHSHHALIVGAGDVRQRMGVRSGAHAGLIGKEAPLRALAQGDFQRRAKAAAQDGLGLEGVLEDHRHRGGEVLGPDHQHHQAAQNEKGRHDGDDLLRDGGQALHAAQENHAADDHQKDPDDPGGHAEGGLEGGADGVGLDHAAEEAQGQDDGDGEEARQELAKGPLESRGDVVHGTALDVAVFVLHPGLLGQHGLGVDGGHAEEGDNPHPEDGPGAAGENRAGSAHDVAGAHLGGNGGGQGLEGAHAPLMPPAGEGEVAKHLPHALAKAADLDKTGLDGEPEAHRDEQAHQDIVRKIGVDGLHDGQKRGLHLL